jgi:hypothetical protein
MLMGASGLQASTMTLWSNGVPENTMTGNQCDSVCNGQSWTVFDNFTVATSKNWVVSSFDFTDFVIGLQNTNDYKNTTWSFWDGDPLSGGKLVASGTKAAGVSLVSGSCGSSSACLETFTVDLSTTPVGLASGHTYYLGASNTFNLSSESSVRGVTLTGGNTIAAIGGSSIAGGHWEQSNGSINVGGKVWTSGTSNTVFPGPLGVTDQFTAFDITGDFAPEPGTFTLLGLALAGMCYIYRRRTA